MARWDGVVIGAGFFGCRVALALRQLGLRRVLLVERERDIMRRASFVNQARVHNGYHYPRSFPTAQRARENYPRFCEEYGFAIVRGMRKYYAIAKGSRVTADQFQRFCDGIGAPCRPAWSRLAPLFDPDFIDDAFEVEEAAFDASLIASRLRRDLHAAGVTLALECSAHVEAAGPPAQLSLARESGPVESVLADAVLNCTYAAIDAAGCGVSTPVKRELAEMALIEPPPELAHAGVTVMDGPFFSVMPFPAAGLHTLSHVRYTPQASWIDPGQAMDAPRRSNATMMLRDAARYMPGLARSRLHRSIFDVKAVLRRHEDDDARPVLYEAHPDNPRLVSILGSKIDNVYDVIETIRTTL
ncbi:FAD-binding oxidoreductase [Alsobacter sp. SYSU M60028]|uniref:FAD-binding oxidoreductase n=1 Tax=Alsobacter ponti TaxID=2962936 RepID=A0ABT1L6G2_9HYPH|nr:FAD-dependent oxidoreductase [Alsobacter ponti]MCP8936945.1 FAD-binding oxidoreductase [Alsobacter ponti]